MANCSVKLNDTSCVTIDNDIVEIQAPKIQLEGLAAINENFEIMADGHIEVKNGCFAGAVTAS